MRATVGDRIVVRGHRLDEPERDAVRADVARLRDAMHRAHDFGGDLVMLATTEMARGVAKVECEASVLWGEIRTAQAESAGAIGAVLEDTLRAVRTVVDELRVQVDLGAAEADEAWQHAVAELARLRDDPAATLDSARAVAAEVFRRLRAVMT